LVDKYILHLGNCLDSLKGVPDNSVDSIVTDPPYGISFMSKKWDYDVPSVEIWKECLRVLKPGGFLLSFSSTRTYHRMTTNIEDAGFEIRECVSWVYASGFPKSHNISASIDKMYGHPNRGRAIPTASSYQACDVDQDNKLTSNPVGPYEPKTDEAKQWQGWGTALKPSQEFIAMARKPLDGTVANNVLTWGTGGINIDAARVPMSDEDYEKLSSGVERIREKGGTMGNSWKNSSDLSGANPVNPAGRWPANFIHDGSQEVLELFPDTKPSKSGGVSYNKDTQHLSGKKLQPRTGHDDNGGSAARFFYVPKASKRDKEEGLDDFEEKVGAKQFNEGMEGQIRSNGTVIKEATKLRNPHPTIKPTELMKYLCRLVTQPGGIVLDPFMGSGSTGKAAILEGFHFIGCELDEEYLAIAEARIKHACSQLPE
jgi:DNA modification methylase